MRRISSLSSIFKIIPYYKNSWYVYLPCMVLLALVRPITNYISGLLMGGMMESSITMTMQPVLDRLPLFFGGLIFSALLLAFGVYGKTISLEKTENVLRSNLFSHVMELPISSIHATHSGDLYAQFSVDAKGAVKACNEMAFLICTLFVGNLASIGYIFAHSRILGLITLGVALMSLAFNGFAAPYMKKLHDIHRGRLANLTSTLSDMLNGHTLLRTDNQREFFEKRTSQAVEDVFESNWRIKKISMFTSAPAELSRFLIDGIIIAAAVWLFTKGQLTPDGVMTCWTLGSGIGFTMRGIARQYLNMQEAMASADRVSALLNCPKESNGNMIDGPKITPAVSIRDLHFSYREDVPVFEGLNFQFETEHSYTVVGTSGSGKSTLAMMMMRFYDPKDGRIEIFGRDVKEYDLHFLRSLIAYVPQNPPLFDDNLWNNIRYGRWDASDDEILKAAQLAQVEAFVVEMPDGYKTRVGENGTQLSGGQRQRVAIARALLKRAPILLLDEATASLDNHFEKDVHAVLSALPKDEVTIITIAHRLSTAVGNDVILVLEDGNVLESGSHEELLSNKGRYTQLWYANQSL